MGTGRKAYRRSIEHRLLPALRAFNPDLIIISAGFDAVKGDVGNAKHMAGGKEKMGLDLEPEDYAWTTQKVKSSFIFYASSRNSVNLPDFKYCGYLLSGEGSFCSRRWIRTYSRRLATWSLAR